MEIGLQPRILGLQLNLLLLLLQLDLHLPSALLLLCQQILRRQLLRLQHLCLHLLHLYFLCQPQHTVLHQLDQKDQVTRIRLHVPSSPEPWTHTTGPPAAKLRHPPPAGRLCSMVSSVHTKCLDLKLNDTFAFWGFDNRYWEREFSSSGLWFRDDSENSSKFQNVWPWLTHIITQLTGFDPQANYPHYLLHLNNRGCHLKPWKETMSWGVVHFVSYRNIPQQRFPQLLMKQFVIHFRFNMAFREALSLKALCNKVISLVCVTDHFFCVF